MRLPTLKLLGPWETSDLISMFYVHWLCDTTVCGWHRNHNRRLRRMGKNSGPIFGVCEPNFVNFWPRRRPFVVSERSPIVYIMLLSENIRR